ncbi:MAG: NUDIX hydrolase [Planctomycetes bacterium]|nr:NUDIX hydrolase [Planctomycetota bacterium]MCB9908994.1 NUDIX hydrolase [Planctomycetota bacterium]MCB9911759.1 NUDIX hydrolase [Planctomycetota bacterium]HPF15111.1 NUDIX hydrolase [Planctomycetota bacterium]
MDLIGIEIVEDRTAESRCDQGFLTLRRLVVQNRYSDGTHSAPYPCDVLQRRGSDAVVAVLYERGADGRIRVVLREAPRVPIYLRRGQAFVHPDPREYLTLLEVVAGMVEGSDPTGQAGLALRAAAEALEEAGASVPVEDFAPLGKETFASPGTGDEKLYFQCAATRLDQARGGSGDGSVMEEWGALHVLDLRAAITACRNGRIPDMKTEVALLRLADQLGYLPQLDCFVQELPADLARKHSYLGVRPPSAP